MHDEDHPELFSDSETERSCAGPQGGGKRKGARARLSETFLTQLQRYWFEHGEKVFEEARKESPLGFLKTVAGIIPRIQHLDVTERREADAADVDSGLSATAAFLRGVGSVSPAAQGKAGASHPVQDELVLPRPLRDGETRH